jgi:hypothetical protein
MVMPVRALVPAMAVIEQGYAVAAIHPLLTGDRRCRDRIRPLFRPG